MFEQKSTAAASAVKSISQEGPVEYRLAVVDVATQTPAPDLRTDPATTAIANRLNKQYHRILQVGGTIHAVMRLLDAQFEALDAYDELTPIWSALSLAMATLEDIAEHLEPPVILAGEHRAILKAA